jgi:hypothetical protein
MSMTVSRDAKEPRNVGERVRSARLERGLGSNELERLVRLPGDRRLSTGYIARLETRGAERDLPVSYAVAIAYALGVQLHWLVEGTGPKRLDAGESIDALSAAKQDQPNLERVLEAQNIRGRWDEQTVLAARGTEVDPPLHVWPEVLDGIERALAPAMKRRTRR